MATGYRIVEFKKRPYAVRWFDPTTGTERQQSLGTKDRHEAERLAGEFVSRLVQGRPAEDLTWSNFRLRFEEERMPVMSEGTRETYGVTFKFFERAVGAIRLQLINAAVLSQFQAWLRKRDLKEITILKHMRQLRAALQWAYDLELIVRMPSVPKGVRGSVPKTMKGRPLSPIEFEQFLEAIQHVVGVEQGAAWSFFSRGLWWQGLRVGEALNLSWDRHDRHRIDLTTQAHPVIWIRGQLEKGKRDRMHPVAPEFAELLRQVPEEERCGQVFRLPGVARSTVSHVGAAIGRRAGLLVRKDALTGKEKYASFHDLRRSCALRWAAHLSPQDLMEFMRHSSMQVTMDYYVGQRAMEVASRMNSYTNQESQLPSN
ncbi:Tyrosine recombinase XerC [Anatilimnocola aggregata]|uniref:Tyrosine recombinase XerC n=1 Tax=Anatilimnocola aggregata TaxID=2528021 RepID=A0A517Y645_9BACT|nr:tyrosine-type recombinase/integrase [Anatilimnocola aggregata]QDU25602.1 Tyrosine recombinase XerC [Anatilimnocola aggregata]